MDTLRVIKPVIYNKNHQVLNEIKNKNTDEYTTVDKPLTDFINGSVSYTHIADDNITKIYTYYKDGKVNEITDNEGRKTKNYYDNDRNLNQQDTYTDTDTDKMITVDYLNNHLGKPKQKTEHLLKSDIYGDSLNKGFIWQRY